MTFAAASMFAALRHGPATGALFERSNTLFAIANFAGNFVQLNPYWSEVLGFSTSELLATSALALVHPDDQPTAQEGMARLAAGEFLVDFEARYRTKTGPYRWLRWYALPDQKLGEIYCVAHDVTAHKAEERERVEALRRLRLAEELAHIGHWRLDLRSDTVWWSDEVYRIHGFEPGSREPTLFTGLDAYHPADRAVIDLSLRQATEQGLPFSFEARLLRPDGTTRWVASRGLAEADGAGRVVAVFGISVDVTDRHLAQAEMQKLAAVASRTSNAVIVADCNGRIEWVNEGFVRLTGYCLEEVRGQKPGRVLQGPETDLAAAELLRAGVASCVPVRTEIVNYAKNGRKYWVDVELQPIWNAEGDVTHFMAVESDVTERKNFERELVAASEQALEASRIKSQFLANMSHEIRTPLNGILGFAQLLLDTTLTPQQREYLALVHDSGQTLLRLLNDILDISKIESGRFEFESLTFSLADVVTDAAHALASGACERGLELIVDLDPALAPRRRGDPTRVRQIVTNLVGNAIKFTRSGEVEISVTGDARRVNLVVRDTGIGIPSERRAHIFDAFTQVDGSTTRKYGGTGLGLTICRQLAEHMGGSIDVESEVGVGSSFHVSLSLPAADQAPPPIAPRLERVLLVEDHPAVRRTLRRALRFWGAEVLEFGDAASALQAVRAGLGHFDAAVLDHSLPDFDGLALAAALGRLPATAAVPKLVLVSAGDCLTDEHTRAAGVCSTLIKPVSTGALGDALARAQGLTDGAAPAQAPEPEGTRRLRVLLAEDNPTNALLGRKLLERDGHEVTHAADGVEALTAIEQGTFDLALMDVQMPKLDGLEVTRRVRQLEAERGGHLPIIALTASAMKGDEERCRLAGVDDYLAKPLDLRLLRQQLLVHTRRAPPASAPRQPPSRPGAPPPVAAAAPAPAAPTPFAVDVTAAIARFGGDAALYESITADFAASLPASLDALQSALAAEDATRLHREVHTLRGLLLLVGATSAADQARRFESRVLATDVAALSGELASLGSDLAALQSACLASADAVTRGARSAVGASPNSAR
ncbi:MAG: response regulator [Polyangiaceae bacterium]|nr:response regulator [Polyangiaceae bacterium]